MTKKVVVSQEAIRVAELEEQIQNVQNNTDISLEGIRSEVKQSAIESRRVILDERQSILNGILGIKGKE